MLTPLLIKYIDLRLLPAGSTRLRLVTPFKEDIGNMLGAKSSSAIY